ncbi:MAG: amidophosphoribosyltransferase [Spirochaetales bacterium]|nr:amidophosphoribosyltransferase [Spirochaetales bacterium]
MNAQNDSLRHHCGVAGFFNQEGENIPERLFYSLFSLQHRGQESAGIAYKKDGHLVVYKDLGMVSGVLSRYLAEQRVSTVGIGHVRYSTRGGNRLENAQPILVSCNKGEIALAHNGNLSNARELRSLLESEGSIFQSSSDSEIILHLLARSRQTLFYDALKETLGLLRGAFSMILIHNATLYTVRDPSGFRPLFIGFKGTTVAVASETCALEVHGIQDSREVQPGELITTDHEGTRAELFNREGTPGRCVFELIYFARPDSRIFNQSVHLTRKKTGAALARCDNVTADIVVPVPDSGSNAALGYAEASGIPMEYGLTRNHYVGRSFIMPNTSERELAVRMKLHPVKEAIKGKRIVLIDDSLVRGTTSKILVKLLKEAGAREVHLRLCAPEIKWPCYFGIDIPTRKELISNTMTPEEIARFIGADSLMFLPLEELKGCLDDPGGYCYACFNGQYPVPVETE